MARSQDFLDEIVAERSEANPGFPEMVEAAYERRQLEAAEHRRKVEGRRAAQAASGSRTVAPLPAPEASPAQR